MDINNMKINEIEDLENLIKMKDKAKLLFSKVAKNQKVDLFSEKKIVWKDAHNSEFLIFKDGMWYWVAAYLHQHYEVPIDEDGIYQLLKNSYIFEKEHKNTCFANKHKEAIGYFESYVSKISTQ